MDRERDLFPKVFFGFLFIFFSLIYLFFHLSANAQGNSIDMWADQTAFDNPYGTVDQGVGFIIPNNFDDALVNDLAKLYDSWGIFLKLKNPPTGILQTTNFTKLNSAGFRWYFMFGDNSAAKDFIANYYKSFSNEVVLEITNYDSGFVQSLKQQFPQLKIHARNFTNFDRSGFQNIVQNSDPAYLDAISTKISDAGNAKYSQIQLMFDTIFDIGEDIDGGTGVKANYKQGTKLSASELVYSNDESWKSVYMSGDIASTIVSSIASSRINKTNIAPFRYTITKDYSQMNNEEKNLAYYYADFFRRKPGLVWPKALGKFKTDHWENPVGNPWNAPNFSNSQPVVGVVGKINSGYYAFFTNASDSVNNLNLINTVSWSQYNGYSTQRGQLSPGGQNYPVSGSVLSLQPRETIVLFDPSVGNNNVPTSPPTQIPTTQLPTEIPTSTNTPTPSISSNNTPTSVNVMTFNYKYIKPHNLNILKSCLMNKNIDFVGFQEMNFMDNTSIDQMKSVLGTAGYRTDDIISSYTVGRREHLIIFYKNKYQLIRGPEEKIIGGPTGSNDDTRKIVTAKLRDPDTNIEYQVFNHHPVSGENEQSCTHNKSSLDFVKSYNNPYSVFFGDFNLKLNAKNPANQTSCNALFDSQLSISCRPGDTSMHTAAECGGKSGSTESNIDFITTLLNGDLKVIDSYYDTCGFSIGDSGSYDSDHEPLFATLSSTGTSHPTCNKEIPQIANPQGTTVNADVPYLITWTQPSNATKYHLRINDIGDSWKGNCGVVQFGNDVCVDNLSGNTYSYVFQPGHTYSIWVHADGPCGYSDAGSVRVNAVSNSKSCTIQGYKTASGEMSSSNIFVSSRHVSVENVNKTLSYDTVDNPYFFEVPGNAEYNVHVSGDVGYSISSSSCINKTDCHKEGDGSFENGSDRLVRCPEAGFVDLWWHYKANSNCVTPDSPVITSVASGNYTSGSNVKLTTTYWDFIDFSANPSVFKVELSVDNQQTWSILADKYRVNYYSTYVPVESKACFRITAVNSCGQVGVVSESVCEGQKPTPTTSLTPQPSPTLIPTTSTLRCYGTQHCTDGNTTLFEYCGNCQGAGCSSAGFTCQNPGHKCKTYPGKVFFFDDVYPLDCSLLTPTPQATNAPANVGISCKSCSQSQPYLCTDKSGGYPFCWDRLAPKSYYNCAACDPSEYQKTQAASVAQSSHFAETTNGLQVYRNQIGNKIERLSVVWSPLKEGFPKLEINTDGGRWDTKLTGTDPYPYNSYTTTLTQSADKSVLVKLSSVDNQGNENLIGTTIIESGKSISEETTPSTPQSTSIPAGSVALAVGGIALGVLVPVLMLGI